MSHKSEFFVFADDLFGRVRRSDLNSRYPSAEPDSPDLELEARFRERLRKSCQESIDIEGTAKSGNEFANAIAPEPASKEDEEVYEFRLFAKPLKPELSREPNHSLQKIALRSPTPKSGEAGFLKTRRPDAYYFTGAVSAERTEQYQRAAVSGGEILEGLKTTWVRTSIPWRLGAVNSQ